MPEPKKDDKKNLDHIKQQSLNAIVTELKSIIRKDLSKKLIEQYSFKLIDEWFETSKSAQFKYAAFNNNNNKRPVTPPSPPQTTQSPAKLPWQQQYEMDNNVSSPSGSNSSQNYARNRAPQYFRYGSANTPPPPQPQPSGGVQYNRNAESKPSRFSRFSKASNRFG